MLDMTLVKDIVFQYTVGCCYRCLTAIETYKILATIHILHDMPMRDTLRPSESVSPPTSPLTEYA